MPSKVVIKVTKGVLSGKEFAYSGKEQLIVGRQEDCSIVLPDKSVSRYHCMVEVTPPYVTVRDFGSLNGTFLNGEKIGQRERSASAEEGQKEYHKEFELHDGDKLGLSRHCELLLHTIPAKCCANCGEELDDETSPEHVPQAFVNDKGEAVCETCYLQQKAGKREAELAAIERAEQEKARVEQERLEKERLKGEKKRKEAEAAAHVLANKLKAAADRAAKEEAERECKEAEALAAALKKAEEELQRKKEAQHRAEEERRQRQAEENEKREAEQKRLLQKKCNGCGKQFAPKAPDNNLCSKCAEDREKLLEAILRQALGAAFAEQDKDSGPAVIKGFCKVKRLGAGGMGEVWLVKEEETEKRYALKTMLPEVAANKQAKNTFLREALLGESLEHKNVIKVYKTGCESGVFFILMELCEGGSVDKYMERCGGKLPLDVATYIMLQVLDGLEYAHHADVSVKCGWRKRSATGVVHRDFKPGNIFLADGSRYPVAKVADFGLAKAFETAGLSKHTRTGTAAGTPVFQPRQQISNYKYSKPDVDVWAAAASYYNMLTGNIPKNLRGRDIWIEMYTEKVVPIRQRDPQIPEKLAAVIDQALVEVPEIGIKTAAELKVRIIKALPDEIKWVAKGAL